MGSITFEISEQLDETLQIVNDFKMAMAKSQSDTMFQLRHFNIIERCIEMYDYIVNDDLSKTTLEKMKGLTETINDIFKSEEYKKDKEDAIEIAKIYTKIKTK